MRSSAAVCALLMLIATSAHGQPAGRIPKIGYLGMLGEPAQRSPFRDAYLSGLRELGYVPGQNVIVEVRRYGGAKDLTEGVADLLRHKVDVLLVGPPAAAVAARQATTNIPIICGSCGDPVENGLARSLARPGGNVTGLASLSAELIGKRVGMVKEVFPGLRAAAVFVFPSNPGTPPTLRSLDDVTRRVGLELPRYEIRTTADLDPAFQKAAGAGIRVVVLQDDPMVRAAAARIAEAALRNKIAVSAGLLELADAGVFLAYGPDRVDMFRRTAAFTDKVLKGAKPGDLPFEQASKLQLVFNLKTARALGIGVPTALLLRADRVIE